MRAICLALLIINLLVFSLQWFFPGSAPGRSESSSGELTSASELRLLTESAELLEDQRPRAPTPVNRSGERSMCLLVGPFDNNEPAQTLVERLVALEVSARLEKIEVSDGMRYWVHLPPEMSERAALRRLHELQAKRIDSYIIPRGDLAHGISLGMYSRESLALERQASLEELGYEAEIAEIPRTHWETWVSLPSSEASRIGDRYWNRLLSDAENLEKRQNFCPGVASRSKFH